MSPTELKMQHTIHLEAKAGHQLRPYEALRSKCIVGCIFYSVGLIITCEIPCIILFLIFQYFLFVFTPTKSVYYVFENRVSFDFSLELIINVKIYF
jgi:hypothetical protein